MRYYALRLDGGEITFLEKADGGGVAAKIAHEGRGQQGYIKKRIGKPLYEDISIRIGWTLSRTLFDWIADSWRAHAPRMDGAVLACDANFTIQSERRFTGALIQEVGFPALDGSSKDTGYLSVRISPEEVSLEKGAGNLDLSMLGKHRLWRGSDFRLEIEGLESAPVRRIEPFAILRAPRSKAGKIDFPNLSIHLQAAGAQSWIDWHKDFLVRGNNDEKHEKEGAIIFLGPDLKSELARIELHNLGIFRLTGEDGDGDQAGGLYAELYCEWMAIHLGRDLS